GRQRIERVRRQSPDRHRRDSTNTPPLLASQRHYRRQVPRTLPGRGTPCGAPALAQGLPATIRILRACQEITRTTLGRFVLYWCWCQTTISSIASALFRRFWTSGCVG